MRLTNDFFHLDRRWKIDLFPAIRVVKTLKRWTENRAVYRLKRHEYTIHVECRCEDRSWQKELGLSSLQRIAAVGLDATSQPLARVCACVRTQRGEFTREGSRLKGCKGNLLSCTVHQGRARQISRPIRVLIHLDRERHALLFLFFESCEK